MRLPHFFIDRPIFATVLSAFIVIIGGFAYLTLPVAQYPEIAPPTIEITARYPGASAAVVSNTVAAPLEQAINGVTDMPIGRASRRDRVCQYVKNSVVRDTIK